MKQRNLILAAAALLSSLAIMADSSAPPKEEKTAPQIAKDLDWIKFEKIRAVYTWAFYHENPKQVVKDLSDTGFNSIFLKASINVGNLDIWLDAAEKYDMKIFICYNYWSIPDKKKINEATRKYRKIVYMDGKEGAAPCPLNRKYWKEFLLPKQLEFAKMSLKRKSIVGLLMDTEMYGIKPHAFLNDVCFCDDCFNRFLKSENKGKIENISKQKRHIWLKERKILKKYYKSLENETASCASFFRNKIHNENPRLLLGNLNFINTWFFRGLASGFGTPSQPTVIAPESPTYTKGCTPFVKEQKELFRKEKFNVFYVPGICDRCFFPDDLAENCYKLAMDADGYFEFTIRGLYGLIEIFNEDLKRKSGGSFKKYWDAFKFANQEIRWKIRLGKYYNSPLDKDNVNLAKGKTFSSLAPLSENWDMKVLCDGKQDFKASLKFETTEKNETVALCIDLGNASQISKVKALCQGGGLRGGVYYPKSLKVYISPGIKKSVNDFKNMEWIDAGESNTPDVDLAFPENGQHSPGGYRRWITVPMTKTFKTRYLKLVFSKIPDSIASEVTKAGEKEAKIIEIDEIEIYPPRFNN